MELIQALLQLLQFVAGANPIAKPPRSASTYLPNYQKLTTGTLHLSANRAPFIEKLLDPANTWSVKAHWDAATAEGLVSKLEKARANATAMAAAPIQPTENVGVPAGSNTVSRFDEYLLIDGGGGLATNTEIGRDLVKGTRSVASVTGSRNDAAAAVVSLRRLDDVLLRVLAAKDAADRTGVSWPEIMAMFRVEGAMPVPCSRPSLAEAWPSAYGVTAGSELTIPDEWSWSGDLDMSHAVFMVDAAAFSPLALDLKRRHALLFWFLLLGGLDKFSTTAKAKKSDFIAWSRSNWQAAGHPDHAAAAARWDRFFDTMTAEDRSADGTTASIVVPESSIDLISGILQEAVMFQKALARVETLLEFPDPLGVGTVTLPASDHLSGTLLTPGMQYLHYHAGSGSKLEKRRNGYLKLDPEGRPLTEADGTPRLFPDGTHVVDGSLRAIIGGALAYVVGTDSLQYLELRNAALGDTDPDGFTIWFANRADWIRAADTNALRAFMFIHWGHVATWLRKANHLALLSDFIESAPGAADAWPSTSWSQHRGNLSRYRMLLHYYQSL